MATREGPEPRRGDGTRSRASSHAAARAPASRTVPTQTWDNRTVHIMSNDPVSETPSAPEISSAPASEEPAEPVENFADMLRDFERSHSHKSEPGAKQLQGTVVSLSAEQVFLDIGYKTEGVLPRSAFENNAEAVKPGDTSPSPSPAATKSTTTSSRASKSPSPATGPPSKQPSRRNSPSSAPSPT